MTDLHLEGKERTALDSLLASLGFPTMTKRQEDIHESYPETFKWLLDREDHSEASDHGFLNWLESGNDLYWISGKPGSGKSTVSAFEKSEMVLCLWGKYSSYIF